jgi:2-methylcitrate dehydratase PrpD
MVAVGLLKGELTAADYEDAAAADPRIDRLRSRMVVSESTRMSAHYLDPTKRSIANSVQVAFRGGQSTRRVVVEYPIGHRRRRAEAVPLLLSKFEENIRTRLSPPAVDRLLGYCADQERLERMPVPDFVALFVA